MSSPNEPGANALRSSTRAASGGGNHSTERGDTPPWQRATSHRAAAQPAARPDPPGQAPSLEERINRFMAGSAVPGAEPEPAPPVRNDAYGSELPDLSAPVARPPAPRPVAERHTREVIATPASKTPRTQVGAARQQGPVRASMQIRRIDPWTVLKVSAVLSIALFFVWMIAVAFLYLVLGGMGVWSKLNSNFGDLLTNTSNTELVSSGAIFGGATMIGLVNIVLLTAMATCGAFIYNLTTDLVGGIEVTLADRD